MFPLDIVYLVIEDLCGDKQSLSRCALVCRQWLRPAHTYLFKRVAISTTPTFSFEDFALFLAAHPGPASHIRRLRLFGERWGPWLWRNRDRRVAVLDAPLLAAILSLAPHIADLTLYKTRIGSPGSVLTVLSRNRILTGSPTGCLNNGPFSLHSLGIRECRGSDGHKPVFDDLLHILALFRSLKYLNFTQSQELIWPSTTSCLGGPTVSDATLGIPGHQWLDGATLWIRRLFVEPVSLTKLYLETCGKWWTDGGGTTNDFLRAVGGNLTCLSLEFAPHDKTYASHGALSLSVCPLLKNFIARIGFFRTSPPAQGAFVPSAFKLVVDMLTHAPPPLSTVELWLIASDSCIVPQQVALDWGRMDHALAALPSLEAVCVIFPEHGDKEGPRKMQDPKCMHDKMPVLFARGVQFELWRD